MKKIRKKIIVLILLLALPTILVLTFKEKDTSFLGIKDDFCFASGSENDIYAISGDGNVWHWNGFWWWEATSGREIENRIHAVSSSQIYGLSMDDDGFYQVYSWDGKVWMPLTSKGEIKDDFDFVSESEIYAIGLDNQVHLWNGKTWEKITSGEYGVKDHIQVVSLNEIYAISDDQNIVRWNGIVWEIVASGENLQDYFIVKSSNEIYAINKSHEVVLWNGQKWMNITKGFFSEKIVINSFSEIYGLGSDSRVWQFNGIEPISITTLETSSLTDYPSTFYRVKYLGGILEDQPAIIAYQDKLIIAGQGRNGSLYAREWAPLRMESWDTCRNGQYDGLTRWYALEGSSNVPPKLTIENQTLYITVKSKKGVVYKKQYYSPGNWSSWQDLGEGELTSGPFSNAGFTVIASNHNGYPSEVSIVRYKEFSTSQDNPEWIKDLIIYEVSIQEFTSPNGSKTGNFKSLTEKMGYLEELGITAVWLSGHSWSDPLHFGNIYTQYANIHPSLVDPTLGSNSSDIQLAEQELRELVVEAHKRGIRVILDLVPHGVMSYSPLVTENKTLPDYVNPHPNQSSIIAHPDWFGAITFPSFEEIPLDQDYRGITTRMIDFVGGYEQSDLDDWWINVCTEYVIDFDVDGFRIDLGSSRFDLWAKIKENALMEGKEIVIIPEGDPDDYPFEVGIYDFEQVDGEWLPISTLNSHNQPDPAMGIVITNMKVAQQEIFPNLKRQYHTIPISCHDSMSYNLNGSLFEAGYGSFFTPFIPIFMAGEEFNNTFTPVSGSNGLWLLMSELQWNEINNTKQNMFYQAIKRIISIRQEEMALHYFSNEPTNPNVIVIENFTSTIDNTPSPYIRFVPDSNEAIIIVGNNNYGEKAKITLNIPLNEIGLESFSSFMITDLWFEDESINSREQLQQLEVTVEPDSFVIMKISVK